MRSFIGWIGGKSHLKNQIISLIPSDSNRYIEVCVVQAGSYSVRIKSKVKWRYLMTLTAT